MSNEEIIKCLDKKGEADNAYYTDKCIKITCKCPTCNKEFSRMVTRQFFLDGPIGMIAFTNCPECDTGETLVGIGKMWK